MKMANMKVGTRLACGFGLVIVLMLVVTWVGIGSMSRMQGRIDEITGVNNVQLRLVTQMRATVTDRMIAIRNIALLTDAAAMAQEADRMKAQQAKYDEAERELAAMFAGENGSQQERQLLAKVKEVEARIAPMLAKGMELGLANQLEEATRYLMNDVRPVQRQWMEALTELMDLETRLNDEAVKAASDAYATARALMLALGAVALAAAVMAAFVITRGLVRRLGGEPDYAAEIAARIAAGDLTVQVETRSGDTSSLLYAMKGMRDSLAGIVADVRQGTDAISTASGEIAAGNQDLSSRTEEQASSLEETASSMEELTSTVRQNADNARQANQLAISASEVATRGGSVVSQVVGTMGAINDSARKVVDIISVIDGIAFQTNILALNAAVEAARAGEQGRGFAVVASEVRTLAQRSAAAAKEIKALIGDSVEKVDAGARLVDEAGATMNEIVDSVRRVTDIMGEIMAASDEQSAGIEQINQAIAQMDQVTQQNASLVEEASAASEAMQDQARKLGQAVGIFRLQAAAVQGLAAAPRPQTVAHPAPAATLAPAARASRALAPAARKPASAKAPAVPAQARARVPVTAGDDWEEF
ncbi:methyl-accepting chemotaxis protein [Noviherbaspirillum aridicola]|uniref:Methyl-accepting chemotaxis protein n=1 Tax=Noviherbaspirillum aridicola TaxID=2849687 RepID=A0ABQ4Q6Q3_9BURK|nr:methyl-accepting chemotaxis protein [Noviherbaspirillum aridicola]GIZ52833.1 methyl-accepting chemotaxis protein [Noviherbaspirillum aridicola]